MHDFRIYGLLICPFASRCFRSFSCVRLIAAIWQLTACPWALISDSSQSRICGAIAIAVMAIAASAQTDAPAATDALASLASKLFPSASFKLAQLNPTWPASFCPASIVMPSTRRSRKALYLTLPPAPTAINKRGAPHSDTTCGSPSATGCCRRRRRLCNVRPFTISLALPVIVARQRQSIRPSYFFVSAYPRRIFLCSAQSGRWLLRTRDQSDKATTRRGDDSKKRTMDGAGRIGSLPPSGWPGSLTTIFRFPAGRLPSSPPSLLTAARGGLHPSWFYEAASVALGARLSRWAGAGIADMDEVVRQGKKPWCCCARGSRRLTPRPAALWFSLLFLKHSCMSSAPASHTHNEPSRIMVPPPPAPCAV